MAFRLAFRGRHILTWDTPAIPGHKHHHHHRPVTVMMNMMTSDDDFDDYDDGGKGTSAEHLPFSHGAG